MAWLGHLQSICLGSRPSHLCPYDDEREKGGLVSIQGNLYQVYIYVYTYFIHHHIQKIKYLVLLLIAKLNFITNINKLIY